MSNRSDNQLQAPMTSPTAEMSTPSDKDSMTVGLAGRVLPAESHDHSSTRPGSNVQTARSDASASAVKLTRGMTGRRLRPASLRGARLMLHLRIPATKLLGGPTERSSWNRSRFMRLFILAGVIGSTLSMLVITIDGLLRRHYSAISQAISDLGRRPHGWVLNKDLIVTGLLIMLFAIGLRAAMGSALGRKSVNVVTGLCLLAGAGIVNDGLFTEYKALELHLLGFYTAFSALTLVFFLVGVRFVLVRDDRRRRWRWYGWYSLLTGFAVLLLTIVYVALPTYATDFSGLIERLIVGAAFGWQCVTGIQLLTPRARTGVVDGDAKS